MKAIPRWRRRSAEQREGQMTLIEHLRELRHRLIVCLWALAAGSVAGFFLSGPTMRLIRAPYCDFLRDNPDRAPFETARCSLVFLGAIDGFVITVKVIVFLALALALPVILYQLWAFIVPGLTARERRWAIPFVVMSLLLFVLGGLAAYLTLPKALGFLLGVGGDFASPLLTVDKYVGFVIFTVLAFGLGFEFPILLISLSAAGVLTSATMRRHRRYVIFGLAIFAAVITPSPDPISMLALLIPLVVFYEGAIIVSRLMKR
ncbi:MAG TPA: twin-arginine translocase subunit TatC [Actinomycetota bacterium]|nr:twin-arginine translocase subunit TatC [Actinomycetota bacterium]